MITRLINAADDPARDKHLQSPKSGQYVGVAASGRDCTMGGQFIIVAPDIETLRIAWNRLMFSTGIALDEQGVYVVSVSVKAKLAEGDGAVPQPSTLNTQPE